MYISCKLKSTMTNLLVISLIMLKKHKKEFREKGYKIHFNLGSILVWPQVSYTIKWKGNK